MDKLRWYISFCILPSAIGNPQKERMTVPLSNVVDTPMLSSRTPDMRLERAVGICNMFINKIEDNRSSYLHWSQTVLRPMAAVDKFRPKPLTARGGSCCRC